MSKQTDAPIPIGPTGEMAPDPVSPDEIDTLVAGLHHDPHAILGAHPGPDGTVVRALRPLAKSVSLVLDDGRKVPMRHLRQGVFSATIETGLADDYRLAVDYSGGPELVGDDPYRHLPTLGEIDLHLIAEGRHEELWRALGAHVRLRTPNSAGTSFSVWAPNARGVRVIGDFNHWDGRAHPMRSLGSSGVWELFVPGLVSGEKYKFEILRAGRLLAPQGRSDGNLRPRCRRPPPRWCSSRTTSGPTTLDVGQGADRSARVSR